MERGIKLPQSPSEWGFKGENYLLIIGIDKYTQWKPLHNAVKDVRDVSKLLTDRYQFEPDKVFTLFDEEATKDKIREKLIHVKRTIKKEDNLVIFFSGHGFYDEEIQEGYWVPVNADKNNPSDYISNSDMLRLIKSIQSHHVLILVDSCFSGSLVSESRGEVLSEKYPSCRIFASGRLELVEDGVAGSNSPFAAAVLRGLSRNTDRVMRSSDLIQNVIKVVESAAGQAPVEGRIKDAGDQGGEFVFYLKSSEEEIWKSVVLNDKKEEYERYLDYFPEGQYISIAKSKLSSFDEDRDWRQVERNPDIDSVRNYLNRHPEGNHYDEALKLLNKLEEENSWSSAKRLETEYAYRNYLRKYPNGQYADLAQKYLEEFTKRVIPEVQKPATPTTDQSVEPEHNQPEEIKAQIKPELKVTAPLPGLTVDDNKPKKSKQLPFIIGGILLLLILVFYGPRFFRGDNPTSEKSVDYLTLLLGKWTLVNDQVNSQSVKGDYPFLINSTWFFKIDYTTLDYYNGFDQNELGNYQLKQNILTIFLKDANGTVLNISKIDGSGMNCSMVDKYGSIHELYFTVVVVSMPPEDVSKDGDIKQNSPIEKKEEPSK